MFKSQAILVSFAVVGALACGIPGNAQEQSPARAEFNFDLYYLQKRNMLEAFTLDDKDQTKFKYKEDADFDVRARINRMVAQNEVFVVTAVYTNKEGEKATEKGTRNPKELVDRTAKKFVLQVKVPPLSEVDFRIEAPGFKPVTLVGLFPEKTDLKVVMPLDKTPPAVQPEICPCPELIYWPYPCPPASRHRLFRR